jgi:NAD(P)-dependent dehydrogenase (short-subunit alcohol dehydrogenase family)
MWPSPFKYHTDTYPAIDPSSPRLSTKGKNIVVSGGALGIGLEITRSFAIPGAGSISILGRTEKRLLGAKAALEKDHPETKIFTYVADIVDKDSLVSAFPAIKKAVGGVGLLVANAGYLPDIHPIPKSDLADWYNGFEVNVKGNFNLVIAFLPVASKGASLINISTGITHLPQVPGYSGYHTSKLAAAKFFEYVHYENPDLFVLNIHPGVIKADMDKKTLAAGVELPYDESELILF